MVELLILVQLWGSRADLERYCNQHRTFRDCPMLLIPNYDGDRGPCFPYACDDDDNSLKSPKELRRDELERKILRPR